MAVGARSNSEKCRSSRLGDNGGTRRYQRRDHKFDELVDDASVAPAADLDARLHLIATQLVWGSGAWVDEAIDTACALVVSDRERPPHSTSVHYRLGRLWLLRSRFC